LTASISLVFLKASSSLIDFRNFLVCIYVYKKIFDTKQN
jgi:hypothetical protein